LIFFPPNNSFCGSYRILTSQMYYSLFYLMFLFVVEIGCVCGRCHCCRFCNAVAKQIVHFVIEAGNLAGIQILLPWTNLGMGPTHFQSEINSYRSKYGSYYLFKCGVSVRHWGSRCKILCYFIKICKKERNKSLDARQWTNSVLLSNSEAAVSIQRTGAVIKKSPRYQTLWTWMQLKARRLVCVWECVCMHARVCVRWTQWRLEPIASAELSFLAPTKLIDLQKNTGNSFP